MQFKYSLHLILQSKYKVYKFEVKTIQVYLFIFQLLFFYISIINFFKSHLLF